jgi:hypothetical protein
VRFPADVQKKQVGLQALNAPCSLLQVAPLPGRPLPSAIDQEGIVAPIGCGDPGSSPPLETATTPESGPSPGSPLGAADLALVDPAATRGIVFGPEPLAHHVAHGQYYKFITRSPQWVEPPGSFWGNQKNYLSIVLLVKDRPGVPTVQWACPASWGALQATSPAAKPPGGAVQVTRSSAACPATCAAARRRERPNAGRTKS